MLSPAARARESENDSSGQVQYYIYTLTYKYIYVYMLILVHMGKLMDVFISCGKVNTVGRPRVLYYIRNIITDLPGCCTSSPVVIKRVFHRRWLLQLVKPCAQYLYISYMYLYYYYLRLERPRFISERSAYIYRYWLKNLIIKKVKFYFIKKQPLDKCVKNTKISTQILLK